jgi:hypothetical protein
MKSKSTGTRKRKTGFAAMSKEKRRKVASMGGKAAAKARAKQN